jgi:hypothetical protein
MADNEPLEHPPEIEEGDNTEAGGGQPVDPVTDDELANTDELEEDDVEDDDE